MVTNPNKQSLNLWKKGCGAGVVYDAEGNAGGFDEAFFFLLALDSLFDCLLIKGVTQFDSGSADLFGSRDKPNLVAHCR